MRRIAAAGFALLVLSGCSLAFSTVGSWTVAKAAPTPIDTNNVVALADGRVAVFRVVTSPTGVSTNQTSIYSPETDSWSVGAPMPLNAFADIVVLLASGDVLVEVGIDPAGKLSGATVLYDPVRNTWTPAGAALEPRTGPAFTVLTDGRVLAAGGGIPLSEPEVLPNGTQVNFKATMSSEIFDPETRSWSKVGEMQSPRDGVSLVALAGGGALAAGGCQGGAGFEPPVTTAEVFDPATLSWTRTAPVPKPVCGATGIGLRDGRALIVDQSGYDLIPYGFQFSSTDESWVYDPKTRGWTAAGGLAGGGWTAVTLSDGRVLVPELRQGAVHGHTFSESVGGQIFDPATNQWVYATTTAIAVPLAFMDQGGNQRSVSLPDGSALVFLPSQTLAFHPQLPPPSTEVLDSTGLTFELGAAAGVIVLLLLLAYRRAIRSDPLKLA